MNILVTGASGFLGQHLITNLEAAGHHVIRYDYLDGCDVRDRDMLDAMTPRNGAVIHLAGILGTDELFDRIPEAIDINVQGTAAVLDACYRKDSRFVGITMPQCWDNIYQATKAAAFKIASAYHRHYGLPVSHVRAFNAYGEGQHLGPVQKIIPTFARRAWLGQPIPIWGDGSQTVDMVYAGDLGKMLADAINHGDNQVFDGGTGIPMTVQQIADIVLAVTNSTAGCEYLPMRRGEHPTEIVAQGEGWDTLGWHPDYDPEAMLRTIVSYKP